MRRNVICLYDLHHPSNFFLPISQPSASNPSTQPPIRRLALPLIRSITQPNARASLYQPTTQSPSFHQPRHTGKTPSSPPPEPTGNSFVPTALTPHPANTGVSEKLCWRVSNDLGAWGLTVSVESLALDRIKSLSASSYSLFNIWWISANQPLSSLFGSHSSNSSSVFIIVAICPFNLFFAAPSFLPLASSSNSSHD